MNHAITAYSHANLSKANFDRIYAQADPREYFRVLCGLDYVIPDLARPIFRTLIDQLRFTLCRPVRVLDVGSSYGINAALARYPIDTRRLAQRYVASEMRALDSGTLTGLDRHYFRSWPQATDARFVGLDASEPAVRYALDAGLLDAAVSADLEHGDPSTRDAEVMSDIDLIFSTGCVGYVTERSFARILSLQKPRRMPWVANFVLRMFSYDAIAEQLAQAGLVTEKLHGVTFVQRRFQSEDEARATLGVLDEKGFDTRGKEGDGLLHAELYVSRPRAAVEAMPLNRLISVTSGGSRRFGRRFAQEAGERIALVH